MKRPIAIVIAMALTLIAFAAPAGATVHEITGMWCAGEHGNHTPPGISGGSNADNLAQPLFASGFVESVEMDGDDTFVHFDLDHPASKLAPHPTMDFFEVEPGFFVTAFVLDEDAGFANCNELRN